MSDDWSLPPFRHDPEAEKPPAPKDESTPDQPRQSFGTNTRPKTPGDPRAPRSGRGGSWIAGLGRWAASPRVRWLWWTLLVLFLAGVITVAVGWVYIDRKYLSDVPPLPARESLFAVNRAPGIRFLDKDGEQIAVRGPRYGERITLGQLPRHVPQAFLAAEDRRFYQHGALDLHGIARAAWVNWQAGRIVQGGSTITQQLAKGLFLTPEQTTRRKVQEAVMARRLFEVMSRDEILELYLNRIFFGANTYGIDGAARSYFGKTASELSLSEAALLAALPKAPSRLALNRNMAGALERQRLILANMEREGWITAQQHAAALADTPVLAAGASREEGDLGYILDYATVEAVRIAGDSSPDLVVKLTIDSRLQAVAAKVVRETVRGDGARAGGRQAALLAMTPDGAIRAMVGGTDFDETAFNRATQARRQPGSTFKPFVYAAALERGVLPTDTREDRPVRFGDWAPENYGGGYSGTVTVATALARSINTVAVQLGQEIGGVGMAELARRFGLSSIPASPNLSVALGSYEVTLLELVRGFQVFQLGGQRRASYIVESVTTDGGQAIFQQGQTSGSPVYDIANASMMVKMMKGVVERGTGTRAAFGRPAAGKTGTSQNWRDAWFVGFTPDYIAGVWVGNDDDRPMNKVAGGGIPSTIWRRFMIEAHKGIAPHDFDWLLPDPIPETEEDPRNGFYQDLSGDFARTVQELEPETFEPYEPYEPYEPDQPYEPGQPYEPMEPRAPPRPMEPSELPPGPIPY